MDLVSLQEVAIYGTNLLDREYFNWSTNFGELFGSVVRSYGFQRRVGVEVTYRFGAEVR